MGLSEHHLQGSAASRDFRDLLPKAVREGEGIRQALTHRSAGGRNNERLEFLGDAVLGLVIADALYEQLPDAPEGDLTRLRAALVNRESLAALARESGLEGMLNLGQGERKSGGQRRDSILADAVEALIGVTYREAGMQAARDFTLALYSERLRNLPSAESLKDPKTRLQEQLQGRNAELPVYEVLDVVGPDHERRFTVSVHLPTQGWGQRGEGSSRRRAEQAAAEAALRRLQQQAQEQ